MSGSKKQSLSTVPESLPQAKTCRKAPLPRSAVKPRVADQAALLWHEVIQALLVAGKVPLRPTTTLADSRDLGTHEGGGGEQPSGPDAGQLVGRLQALIMENEVAAELAVQAVAQLSWEQLQTVQLEGASAASAHRGAHRSDAKQGAHTAGHKDHKQARNDIEKPAPPLLNHVWKADLWREQQQRRLPAPSDVAKYAQILAGKHWHAEPASAAEAAAGSAGTRASVSGPHHNTWQRASIVAGVHRALVLQRFGAPRESVMAASPGILSPDITPTQAPPASTSGVHHHSYTGLSYAAWHPVPASNTDVEARNAGVPPSASSQMRRRFSAAFDGSPGGPFGMPPAAPAAPTFDAIFLAKGPGLYPLKGAQGIRSEMQEARQAAVALGVRSSNAEQGTASKPFSVTRSVAQGSLAV
ncbi:g3731 [Coccomyxa elongata]